MDAVIATLFELAGLILRNVDGADRRMQIEEKRSDQGELSDVGRKAAWKRFFRSRDGAAAIEFAFLSLPYFLIVIAILETFLAFTGEQVIANATDTFARKIRTGRITFALGRTTDMTQTQFRQAFCTEISILIRCSASEIAMPAKLYIDLQAFNDFSLIPKTIPKLSTAKYADLDTSKFKFTPGGPGRINMLRVYYRWQIMTDIVRPYLTTIRPADGSMPRDFLIVATSAFQNELYP
jgi:Flp pilus assembly protein TadG